MFMKCNFNVKSVELVIFVSLYDNSDGSKMSESTYVPYVCTPVTQEVLKIS